MLDARCTLFFHDLGLLRLLRWAGRPPDGYSIWERVLVRHRSERGERGLWTPRKGGEVQLPVRGQ